MDLLHEELPSIKVKVTSTNELYFIKIIFVCIYMYVNLVHFQIPKDDTKIEEVGNY